MTSIPLHLQVRARAPTVAEDTLAYADGLYNLARYLTGDAAEAEDLVQETYVRALRAWDDFTVGTNVKAWLFRILRNGVISRQRHELRHPAPAPYDTTEPVLEGATASVPAAAGDPDQLRRLVSADIEAALRLLPEDARTVILLDLEGFTENELACMLGCAVGTVKSLLHRARATLRLELADYATREHP